MQNQRTPHKKMTDSNKATSSGVSVTKADKQQQQQQTISNDMMAQVAYKERFIMRWKVVLYLVMVLSSIAITLSIIVFQRVGNALVIVSPGTSASISTSATTTT